MARLRRSPGKRVLRLYPVIGTTDRRVDRQTDAPLGPPSRSMNVIQIRNTQYKHIHHTADRIRGRKSRALTLFRVTNCVMTKPTARGGGTALDGRADHREAPPWPKRAALAQAQDV